MMPKVRTGSEEEGLHGAGEGLVGVRVAGTGEGDESCGDEGEPGTLGSSGEDERVLLGIVFLSVGMVDRHDV